MRVEHFCIVVALLASPPLIAAAEESKHTYLVQKALGKDGSQPDDRAKLRARQFMAILKDKLGTEVEVLPWEETGCADTSACDMVSLRQSETKYPLVVDTSKLDDDHGKVRRLGDFKCTMNEDECWRYALRDSAVVVKDHHKDIHTRSAAEAQRIEKARRLGTN